MFCATLGAHPSGWLAFSQAFTLHHLPQSFNLCRLATMPTSPALGFTPSRTPITFNDRSTHGFQLPQSPATCCAPSDVTHQVCSDVLDLHASSKTGASPLLSTRFFLHFTREHRIAQSTAGPAPPSGPLGAPHAAGATREAHGSDTRARHSSSDGQLTKL